MEVVMNLRVLPDDEFEKIIKTIKSLPKVDLYLRHLMHTFGTLTAILQDENAKILYHKLMIFVIRQHEINEGNITVSGLNFVVNKNFDEILKKYGGTGMLPLV